MAVAPGSVSGRRLRAPFDGDARGLFADLVAAQRGAWSAFVDLATHAICSASPELFFSLGAGRIECRPMKGTMPRGLTPSADVTQADPRHWQMTSTVTADVEDAGLAGTFAALFPSGSVTGAPKQRSMEINSVRGWMEGGAGFVGRIYTGAHSSWYS